MPAPQMIADRFAPLKGAPCWNVRQGYGSFLTLEFGSPRLEIHGPTRRRKRSVFVKGEYHLWIQMCSWDILRDGQVVATSESTGESIEAALWDIDSMYLEHVCCDAGDMRASFIFESGAEISMRGYDDFDPDSDIWILFMPAGNVAYQTSGNISLSFSDTDQEEQLEFEHLKIVLGSEGDEIAVLVE